MTASTHARRRPGRLGRRLAPLLAIALLPGCGNGEPASQPVTELTVEVRPEGPDRGAITRTTIECDGAEGRDSETCQRLDALAVNALAPVPPGRVCTQIYGGPATALVRGRLRGRPVVGRFSLRNGCQIDRWERFAWLIGEPPATAGR